uniref:Transcription initiation factor TFIID subunit 6 n=1 Tax=Steinernema glaseri TaxID=37863 RepID=A0A1I7Z147_9BILA
MPVAPSTADPSTSQGQEIDNVFVRFVGETCGVADITEAGCSLVAASVSEVLHDLLTKSRKFAVHGRRSRILTTDFENALVEKGFQPIFGIKAKDPIPFKIAGTLGRDIYVSDEAELDLSPLVNAAPPRLPLDSAIKAHWLVIDGEQPSVPENPLPETLKESMPEKMDTDLTSQMENNDYSGPLLNARNIPQTEQVQIKTTTTHALCMEQQIFFKEITEAIMGGDEIKRTEALHSLQTDCGLKALLPRFSLAIAEGVKCNIVQHQLAILIYLMRMIQSLALNTSVSLDRCLHELLPAMLSCILSRQLCARPDADNHWALREFSSRLLAMMCRNYQIHNVRARVTQVLGGVWKDNGPSCATLYGSMYALQEIGWDAFRSIVVPHAAFLSQYIIKVKEDKSEKNLAERIAADKLLNGATKAFISYAKTQKHLFKDLNDCIEVFSSFGESVYKQLMNEAPSAPSSRQSNGRPHQQAAKA